MALYFQIMYCSEDCRDTDWSSVHSSTCRKTLHVLNTESLQPIETQCIPDEETHATAIQEIEIRLITFIGLETIMETALENRPMSLFKDQRTKGFHNGKFEAITLESLLSLEDNFDKLTIDEKEEHSIVRTQFNLLYDLLIKDLKR